MAIDVSKLVPGRLYRFITISPTLRGAPVPPDVRTRIFVRTCIVGAAGMPAAVCVIVEAFDGRRQLIAVDLLDSVSLEPCH